MTYCPGTPASLTHESKSQIAIEYAYRLRERHPETSLFWVSANSAARFEQSYRGIAKSVKIPGMEDPKSDVLHLVNQWLSGSESGAWLLILDNADDAELFFGPLATQAGTDVESALLSRYLPQTGTGSILTTSRNQGTALDLTGGQKQVLHVGVMSNDDAFALLTKKLPEDPSDKSVKEELMVELDSVPLAITQASAYIRARAPRMTVAKYVQLLRHGERNQIQLLSNDEADLRRDPGVPNSVIRTWQITISQIKTQNPEAADLLSCMCMLDRQGIPEFLICQDADQSLGLENAIGVLLQFSLVVEEKEKNVFAIHRLVQLATRKWIKTCEKLEHYQKAALRLVHQRYPEGIYENWRICGALEPHAQIVLSYIFDSKDCQLQQAGLLRNGAWYAMEQGKLRSSEDMLQKSLDIKGVYLEADDPDILDTLGLLAAMYMEQGRRTEAEKLHTQVLEVKERVWGAEHPNTLTTMSNLAEIYNGQGRWAEAEKLNEKTLEIRGKVLGAEHPKTINSMNNLASIYDHQARWTEAEDLRVQTLEVSKRVLGAEHPHTLIVMSNLASTYGGQARWTEAEKLEAQSLEVRRRVLGAEHPDTIASMNNLASTYTNQARGTEAEELQVQTLEVSKRVLGADHPRTLATMSNLASTYNSQARWTEAEKLEVQSLEVWRRVLGAEHPGTLTSMNNLAHTYDGQNRHSEAIELTEKVVELRGKTLGPEHPDTIASMVLLACWYYDQNRHSEVIELMENVVEWRKKSLGEDHPDTSISMHNLAMSYNAQNRHSEAIKLMEKVVELREKTLGRDNPMTIRSTKSLAECKATQVAT